MNSGFAGIIKKVWKLNFRQYGQTEKNSQEEAQPWRKSEGRRSEMEKVRREKIRDGESQKTEDAGARKGSKVAKDCVFPMFCGCGGSKSRLATAAGEPARRCGAKHILK